MLHHLHNRDDYITYIFIYLTCKGNFQHPTQSQSSLTRTSSIPHCPTRILERVHQCGEHSWYWRTNFLYTVNRCLNIIVQWATPTHPKLHPWEASSTTKWNTRHNRLQPHTSGSSLPSNSAMQWHAAWNRKYNAMRTMSSAFTKGLDLESLLPTQSLSSTTNL